MNTDFDLSIVISSFNRDNKILQTVSRIFESDFSGFQNIELIIIDDGSPLPVEKILSDLKEIPSVIDLKLLRQENSGIGATRNRGFRVANSNLIMFLDDDILIKKETIKEIFEAHQDKPGGVFFGSCPFISHESEALRRFASSLFGYDEINTEKSYERVNAVASALLFVNKTQLSGIENFYQDYLTIPASEEYEIIYRFHKLDIPVFRAKHISAIHNHHLELGWLVQQQYKYGMATAEVFIKNPEIIKMRKFAELGVTLNMSKSINARGIAKTLLASNFGRKILLRLAGTLNNLLPNGNHDIVFGLLTTAYFRAGYREGSRKFANNADKNE